MMATKLTRLYTDYGQSMWYDNISRGLLNSGGLKALVDDGIRGLTSNPSIFEKAIVNGSEYDDQLRTLAREGRSPQQIFDAMSIQDIQHACDILRPVFDESGGGDGFASLEVSPLLAHGTQETIHEAARLWKAVDRPNVMIKIPATPEGLPAIEESLASGLNVNITLMFSRDVYGQVMDAYLNGLKRRADSGQPVDHIRSVASFFVSRVDTLVDSLLDAQIASADGDTLKKRLQGLRGKAGIANTRLAYALFKEKFAGDLYQALKAKGAALQRPLWASTSTKDPAYPDTLYVDSLIGPHTVNTAPPETIDAWRDHGALAATIEQDLDDARKTLDDLESHGINMQAVTQQLLDEGVIKFEKPYEKLLKSIEDKSKQLITA
jgi:transaldolase